LEYFKVIIKYKSVILTFIAYAIAVEAAHLLLITTVTSFVLLAGRNGLELSNVVNEISSQYTFLAYALAALLVALTLFFTDRALYRKTAFWTSESKKAWHLERQSKQEFFRGASTGLLTIAILLVLLHAANQISFLGVFITSTFGTPVFPLFLVDTLALIVIIFSEEYIFRQKIMRSLQLHMSNAHANVLTSLLYILLKLLQFELEWIDVLNLFLLNLILGFFSFKSGRFHRGLGFLLVFFVGIHLFAGMPLWQHISPSVFLFKHVSKASVYLSGGDAGPMASVGMLSILIFLAISSYLSWKGDN
jgi:membrane protease YdiL (CAAX protease family)